MLCKDKLSSHKTMLTNRRTTSDTGGTWDKLCRSCWRQSEKGSAATRNAARMRWKRPDSRSDGLTWPRQTPAPSVFKFKLAHVSAEGLEMATGKVTTSPFAEFLEDGESLPHFLAVETLPQLHKQIL